MAGRKIAAVAAAEGNSVATAATTASALAAGTVIVITTCKAGAATGAATAKRRPLRVCPVVYVTVIWLASTPNREAAAFVILVVKAVFATTVMF
eukprot:scaffold112404_cov63-Phaeocystis_antarctica.AAC.1